MTVDEILSANAELRSLPPRGIVRWAIARSNERAIVSTNFRPYEAVFLHLCVQEKPDIPVLWVDHGYNRPATYRHAEQLKKMLGLNLKIYLPKISVAHRRAVFGEIPSLDDEAALKQFSAQMKIEPFQRGMREIAPAVWLTALRRTQNPGRAAMDIVSEDKNFGALKVNPVLNWTDAQMEDYLKRHNLPIEWDYFDPAKSDEKRECGLHAAWGADAVVSSGAGI
ncbi:MAG: phosphoadenosine phosphosulfate reductase family protein [Limisphaerales bacterium]